MTLAQVIFGGYSFLQILIFVIIAAAAIAILYVILQWMGVTIPPQLVKVAWILIAAFVGIVALIFLFRMANSV